MSPRVLTLLAALVLLPTAAAAREATVRLPEGFTATPEVHVVEGYSPRRFRQPLVFGPYSARVQDGGDTAGGTMPLGRLDLREGERRHAFLLTTVGQPAIGVDCVGQAVELADEDEDGGWAIELTPAAGPVLECALGISADEPDRRLSLEVTDRGHAGRFASPWGELRIASLHGYAGSRFTSPEPTGFVITHDGRPQLVVDLLNRGRVLMDPALDARQRAWLAALAAALLLSPAVEPG